MIKVEIYDTLIPMLEEMSKRSLGLVAESLQVSGSKIAKYARIEMNKQKHHWFNAFIDGKYKIWESTTASKRFGFMMSHKQGGLHEPGRISRMVSFYLSPNQLTITVGGTHPYFKPRQYKDGIHVGYYGDAVKAVGVKGRAIIHKLNTGDVSSEHPYYGGGDNTMIQNANYVKGRHFMEKGFAAARGDIDKSLGKRFEKSFGVAVNRIDVKGVKRKFG